MNDLGWYVAHLYPAKNRDTGWEAWSHAEVRRRFYLTLHPCNLFFVPGTHNVDHGENPCVIGFISERYAERYGTIWTEFVDIIGGSAFPTRPAFGERAVSAVPRCGQPANGLQSRARRWALVGVSARFRCVTALRG
jgi:hypothetical protein